MRWIFKEPEGKTEGSRMRQRKNSKDPGKAKYGRGREDRIDDGRPGATGRGSSGDETKNGVSG
jgi:hypothetical protein